MNLYPSFIAFQGHFFQKFSWSWHWHFFVRRRAICLYLCLKNYHWSCKQGRETDWEDSPPKSHLQWFLITILPERLILSCNHGKHRCTAAVPFSILTTHLLFQQHSTYLVDDKAGARVNELDCHGRNTLNIEACSSKFVCLVTPTSLDSL